MNDKRTPMPLNDLVDEYFFENRHRLLDIAAFLDRLDRSADGRNPSEDFRVEALRRAISVLSQPGPDRAKRIHMIFSDPTNDPRPALDRKAAYGAYRPAKEAQQ
jgi:hypothetical protein